MTYGHSNVSGLESELEAAYRATTYVVEGQHGNISIRIGQTTPLLDQLLIARGGKDWAFISACNPGSRPLPEKQNLERHAQLVAAVDALGLPWLIGHGIPDHPGWQPELSLLIPGIPLEQAIKLASAFDQNAIVVGAIGTPARLCYTRGNSP